jgi:glycosyltransferase involved in cell wall biosynthesis
MFCGGCFRDNALVAELRRLGHDTLMVPLYLPFTLDEGDQSAGTPIFFSGINVYLEQKFPWFRHAPGFARRWFESPRLLKLVGTRAAKTRPADVGELTVSMLRGEEGNQAREVEELAAWLRQQHPPAVISLSNVLLIGMARRLKQELAAPVVCMLQGEDAFLDALPPSQRETAWRTLGERCADVDLFIAPSRYFAGVMAGRLGISPDRVRVVHNGINLDGYEVAARGEKPPGAPPVLGYFARLCRDKGLDLAVDVFIELKRRAKVPALQFHAGGGCGPGDEPFVAEQRAKLERAGALADVKFAPNLSRAEKIEFLRSLDVFSTPALYGEAFGLYVIEAMAAGVPVVQPKHGGFTEIVEETRGGLICAPDAGALADGIEALLLDAARRRELGRQGRQAVAARFSARQMAADTLAAFTDAARKN